MIRPAGSDAETFGVGEVAIMDADSEGTSNLVSPRANDTWYSVVLNGSHMNEDKGSGRRVGGILNNRGLTVGCDPPWTPIMTEHVPTTESP